MKDVLLDTHVWVWISIDDRRSLSRKARSMLIDQPSGRKWISAISCWELAKLVERGRIGFSIPVLTWIRRSLVENQIQVAELSPEIAVESTQLTGFHRDPADQIIAATSRVLGMPLLTADADLQKYPGLESIW
ncbi:MAG: type II toxin-antitoxin system VapC family toxin [Deltaproteobacteria bacterium]|nr:type II toxin-antitoxin system VapC family toxin [Deltaproteobacteria bacterium]